MSKLSDYRCPRGPSPCLLKKGRLLVCRREETHVPCRVFQLSQLCPEENLDKLIPCLAGPDSFYVERNHVDLEAGLR